MFTRKRLSLLLMTETLNNKQKQKQNDRLYKMQRNLTVAIAFSCALKRTKKSG